MLYAINNDGFKQEASPDAIAYCPHCEAEMIPKCGFINIWHWAHKNKTTECDYKPETDWHLEWKKRALLFNCDVEVRIGNNIVDIINNNSKRLIELQHSTINTDEMINRCENYKKHGYMVDWIFDFKEKVQNDQLILNHHENYTGFRQKWSKKQLVYLFDASLHPKYGRVWFDLHESLPLFLVKKLYEKGGGYGIYAERDSPIDKIKTFV